MGRKRLPWFKVQSGLTDHPKFRTLAPSMRGNLISLWCCAACQPERGILPSIAEISYHLGKSYQINPARTKSLLDTCVSLGFLDLSNGRYYVHDWAYWQSESAPVQQIDQQFDQQFDQQSVEAGKEPIAVTAEYGVPRKIRGIDKGYTSYNPAAGGPQSSGNGSVDSRYHALRKYITSAWLEHRNCSISACTTNKDWVQVASMLRRTRNDSQFTLQALCNAFYVWLSSSTAWERKQSLGYWASNAHRYLRMESGLEVADDLEWWKQV